MMKKLVFIFFVFQSALGFCQDTTKAKGSAQPLYGTNYILYGTRLPQNNFYSQLNTVGKYNFSSPLQMIGIGQGRYVSLTGRYTSVWRVVHYSYSQIIPQKIIVNDTINCNVNGYVFSFCIAPLSLFRKSKFISLHISYGFNTGRLRLSGNELVNQKNPFFSPMISVRPVISIKNIRFTLRGDYEYDVSKPSWRRTYFTSKNKTDLEKFKETGITFFFGIGIIFQDHFSD